MEDKTISSINFLTKVERKIKDFGILEFFLILAYFLLLIYLSYTHMFSTYQFPDEMNRMALPKFIYEHGKLPLGTEKSVLVPGQGFSYSVYPMYFGPLVSAFFMKLASFYSTHLNVLIFGARLTSIFAGTFSIYFAFKIGKEIFEKPFHWIPAVLLVSVPQMTFLSIYVNNDIIAVLSSAIILYSWILGLKYGWNYANLSLLSLGVIICALSYYNAYGWILASIIIYIVSSYYQAKEQANFDKRSLLKKTAFAIIFVLIGIAFFFIRNGILNHGDILGLRTGSEISELKAEWASKPSNRNTPQNLGFNLRGMLMSKHWTGHTWIELTFKSFILGFSMMSVFAKNFVYYFYSIVWGVGLLSGIVAFLNKKLVIPNFSKKDFNLLLSNLILILLVVSGLVLYYSYASDYQPQGRYFYPLMLSLLFLTSLGWKNFFTSISTDENKRNIAFGIFIGMQLMMLGMCLNLYLM